MFNIFYLEKYIGNDKTLFLTPFFLWKHNLVPAVNEIVIGIGIVTMTVIETGTGIATKVETWPAEEIATKT